MIAVASWVFAVTAAVTGVQSPPPPASSLAFEGGSRLDVRIEGKLLDLAFPVGTDGARDVVALLAPRRSTDDAGDCRAVDPLADPGPEGRPRLLRLVLEGPGGWEVLVEGLDPTSATLDAHDLDGDGSDEILVGREDAIEVLRSASEGGAIVLPLPEGSGVPLFLPGDGASRGPAPLHVLALGALETLGPSDEPPGFARIASSTLPIDVRGRGRRFRLGTRPFAALGPARPAGGSVVSLPEEVGPRRLRVFRMEAGVGRDPVECWARLPEPERLIDSAIVLLDGEPALVATTTTAEKLSLFGEKRLRVFRLEADRTRTGVGPILAAETKANVWQRVFARVADADGDGRDDLVLGYWKGLKDSTVAIEVWSRSKDGPWPRSPKATSFDVPEGDRSFLLYGDDLDADGLPDLLVAGNGSLRLHRGARGLRGGRPFDPSPSSILPLPEGTSELGRTVVGFGSGGFFEGTTSSGLGPPVPVDLDGDGRREIVLFGTEGDSARVVVYRLDRRPDR